jgi:predicted amidophosphoribosyltransferase
MLPSFRLRMPTPAGAVLIDDVVTTGTTLVAASSTTGSRLAITFTASGSCG